MTKSILVITQYFYPENFRINDICAELVKKGYKVTVLTGIPNYPEGKFYKGYGWNKKRKETVNGVDVIRLPIISRGKSKIRIVLNYYSFVIAGWFWNLFSRVKADILFTFEVSPLIQAKIGSWYSKKHKVPHFLYVQDLWPESLETVGGIHSKFILNHYGKMANKIYKNCDKIFATSPSFVEEIKKRVFENKEKVVYLPQYAEDFYKPLDKESVHEIPKTESFKLIFTGNVGHAQGLDVLYKTAKILKEKGIDVLFVILGDGRYKGEFIKKTEDAKVSDMFLFIQRQPAERIPEFLADCDAAFLSFMDDPLFNKTIPAKLQSYMACAKPIIASAGGETERVIKEANCGYCVKIGNAVDLANLLCEVIKHNNLKKLGKNGFDYYKSNFDKQKIITTIDNFFKG